VHVGVGLKSDLQKYGRERHADRMKARNPSSSRPAPDHRAAPSPYSNQDANAGNGNLTQDEALERAIRASVGGGNAPEPKLRRSVGDADGAANRSDRKAAPSQPHSAHDVKAGNANLSEDEALKHALRASATANLAATDEDAANLQRALRESLVLAAEHEKRPEHPDAPTRSAERAHTPAAALRQSQPEQKKQSEHTEVETQSAECHVTQTSPGRCDHQASDKVPAVVAMEAASDPDLALAIKRSLQPQSTKRHVAQASPGPCDHQARDKAPAVVPMEAASESVLPLRADHDEGADHIKPSARSGGNRDELDPRAEEAGRSKVDTSSGEKRHESDIDSTRALGLNEKPAAVLSAADEHVKACRELRANIYALHTTISPPEGKRDKPLLLPSMEEIQSLGRRQFEVMSRVVTKTLHQSKKMKDQERKQACGRTLRWIGKEFAVVRPKGEPGSEKGSLLLLYFRVMHAS